MVLRIKKNICGQAKKEDVTAGVLAAAYEWFMGNMDGCDEYSISYPDTGFELVMRRKKLNKFKVCSFCSVKPW